MEKQKLKVIEERLVSLLMNYLETRRPMREVEGFVQALRLLPDFVPAEEERKDEQQKQPQQIVKRSK